MEHSAGANTYRISPKRGRYWLWLGAIILCLLVTWLVFSHKKQSEPASGEAHHHGAHGKDGKDSGPMPVGVATVKTGDIPIYVNGLGTVTPRNIVTVHSRVDGQLMRVLFKEGQPVKAGDLLAELDVRPYQAQLEQAQGALMRDEALLNVAKLDLERYKILFSQDSIAKQQLDTQAALVKQDEGAIKIDQGQVDNAQTQVDYTKITAPVDGRVGLRQVDPGNIVHASDANGIVVVTQLQPITVIFPLPEDNLPQIMQHLQHNASLLVEAWDRDNKNKLADGKLSAVDNQVDVATGTVKLRAEFTNEQNTLFPSQFVNARMLLDTLRDVTLVPTAAIQRGTQGTFVYLAKEDNTVAVQPVTLGSSEGRIASISKGLNEGDVVVVDGADSLRDGAKIEMATKDGTPIKKPIDTDSSPNQEEDAQKSEHRHHKRDNGTSASKGATTGNP